MPPFSPNENRGLTPAIKPSSPAVSTPVSPGEMGPGMLGKPLRSTPTIHDRPGTATLGPGLKMDRVKSGPSPSGGFSGDRLKRGGDAPWAKGR
jgi:hypothetical protein